MAIWRLIKNSIRFSFRAKKRWITFVIIFALLSAFVTLFVSTFNGYATEQLMTQKGFYIKAAGVGTVTEQQGNNFYDDIVVLPQVEKVSLFRYFDLGDSIRIFSVEPNAKWMFFDAKPSKIIDGRYIVNDNEALVSVDASLTADIGNISSTLTATLHKGETLHFSLGNSELNVEIVGEIQDTINAPGKFKLFVSDNTFDQIQDTYSDNAPVFCYSIAILVKGNLFKPFDHEIRNNIETLAPQSSILWIDPDNSSQTSTYGVWAEPIVPDARASEKQRTTDFLYFIVGILGGMVLVILYNALIVWFRKREIAVLRAMGYKKREIRINLLGESLTISLLGFIIGLSAMIIYFWSQGFTFTNQVITPLTLLLSFGIIVGLSVPGLLISSISFTRVNPILLFKGR